LTDAQLVERALAGHEDGFRELLARYQRPVFNLLARMLRDAALAEDLTQETFLKAHRHLRTFDPRYKFSNWILRIAHNSAIDALRRRGPQEVSLDDPDSPERATLDASLVDSKTETAERLMERRDVALALESALARLRPEYRRLVVMRYQEDLGYEDIAEVTGLPLGTVKSHLHRARGEMADFLAKTGWRP